MAFQYCESWSLNLRWCFLEESQDFFQLTSVQLIFIILEGMNTATSMSKASLIESYLYLDVMKAKLLDNHKDFNIILTHQQDTPEQKLVCFYGYV